MTVNQARLPHLVLIGIYAVLSGCSEAPLSEEQAPSEVSQSHADEPRLRFLSQVSADAEIAARVGETVITVADVRREAAAQGSGEAAEVLHPSAPAFRQVLRELIDQRLLALEAAERNLQNDVDAWRRLAAAEERILGNVLVETAISDAVSEEAVLRVYEEQAALAPQVTEVRARHILVATREEADEVYRLLFDGADFAQLAAELSRDPATRFEGGDLGYFTRQGILEAFADVAFSIAIGEVSQPFQSEYGWHVLVVTNVRRQPRPTLDDKRAEIVRFLTLQGIDELLAQTREAYPVTIVSGAAPEGLRSGEDAPDPENPSTAEPDEEAEADLPQ